MAEASRSAFIVANDEYADQRLRRLRAPAADARELGSVLADPDVGGFDVALSVNEPEHVLRRRLSAFFENRGVDDMLLLHLSCHGVKDEDGRLYFATSDTQMEHLEATALPAEFVNRQMTRSRSRRVVLLLDCCYSGAFARGWMSRAGDRVDIQERFDGRGRIVLTASSAMEYSFEGDQLTGEGSPSVFTSALVQGLATGEADRNRDGYVSVDELYDYAFDEVRAATPSQTPGKWVFDVQGDFAVARSRLEPLPPAGLPPELVAATMSPFAHVRLGAAAELRGLLDHPDELLATQAREHLTAMLADDSQRVSRAAAEGLSGGGGSAEPASETGPEPLPAPTPEPVPTAAPAPAAPPRPAPKPASDEPQPPQRVRWLGRVGALGLLAVVPHSLVTFEDSGSQTGWNAFAALSPIEGVLAAVTVWLLVDALHSGRVPSSVGAGALLVIGASSSVSALGLAVFSAEWSQSATPYAFVVLGGSLLTCVAGVQTLRVALPAARPAAVGTGPPLLGGAGVGLGVVALFVTYDGESSLLSELGLFSEYFYSAAFGCVLALGSLLSLRAWQRLAAGALLASGGVLAVHYLGIVLASARAIGEAGGTGVAGFIGILGGLLVASAGGYAYVAARPRDEALGSQED
jgi:hypothetical protein